MIKTIGIVSLSAGTIGEDFVRHELEIGLKRLAGFGVKVRFMPSALKGRAYVQAHPECRAADLLAAFRDPEIDLILSAIGGEDTYRLLPWLFDRDELSKAVRNKPFLGFSDSTVNHFMLHKVGLKTFYGQAFLSDICEIGPDMLPYTKRYFEELLTTGTIHKITPSDLWYEAREDYSPEAVGTLLPAHPNRGFELWQGPGMFSGPVLGGCLDTIYDLFFNERFPDTAELSRRYHLFPDAADWKGRILLLETSEEVMPPEKFEKALRALKEAGVFGAVSGVLLGKPMNEIHLREYREILPRVIGDPALPVLANVNIGHALPRCIIPFGRNAVVNAAAQEITFTE